MKSTAARTRAHPGEPCHAQDRYSAQLKRRVLSAHLVCVRGRRLGRAASVFRRSAPVCKFEQEKETGCRGRKTKRKRISEGARSQRTIGINSKTACALQKDQRGALPCDQSEPPERKKDLSRLFVGSGSPGGSSAQTQTMGITQPSSMSNPMMWQRLWAAKGETGRPGGRLSFGSVCAEGSSGWNPFGLRARRDSSQRRQGRDRRNRLATGFPTVLFTGASGGGKRGGSGIIPCDSFVRCNLLTCNAVLGGPERPTHPPGTASVMS